MNIVEKARKYMKAQTSINKAPVWCITEIAIKKGKALAKRYKQDEELIVLALYLAHTAFSEEVGGAIQKNHPRLSAQLAKDFLKKNNYPKDKINLITNAIKNHHKTKRLNNKTAEIIKNAECFKFFSKKGAMAYYNDLLRRGYSKKVAKKLVLKKIDTKYSILTIPELNKEIINKILVLKKLISRQ